MMQESEDAQPGGLACGESRDAASTVTQGDAGAQLQIQMNCRASKELRQFLAICIRVVSSLPKCYSKV